MRPVLVIRCVEMNVGALLYATIFSQHLNVFFEWNLMQPQGISCF